MVIRGLPYRNRYPLNALRLLSVSSALFIAACSGERITKGGPPAVTISITPDSKSLFSGQIVQFVATARDASGNPILGASYSWSSSNPASVTIARDGKAAGLAFGSSTISVASQGITASAVVQVLHDPVVFVHGFQASGAIWTTMIDRLKADGWADSLLVTWTYDSNQSNVATAQLLKTKVDSLLAVTGATKVDIITHSMGGLSSRYFEKNFSGSEKTDALVFLGTPNHGTALAELCGIQSCLEMRPGSSFLVALNAGDETPGSTRYATWRTPCDQVTIPPESVMLEGANNTETACMAHGDLYMNSTVYAQVRDWIK